MAGGSGQRGQAADDQRRADALQGLPQHVVADAVGAQRVIAGGQPDQRARRHAQQNEGQAHGAPRQFAAPPGPRRRRPRRRRAGARQAASRNVPASPAARPPASPRPRRLSTSAGRSRSGSARCFARAAQQREIAHRLVVHQRGFLGELAHRQRRGIGFLGTRQHAAVQQPVQRRAHDGRVGGRGVGRRARRRWQQRPVVDGIEQPDDDEGRQDHGRTHGRRVARDTPPGGAQRRTAAHVPGVGQHPQRHQPERDIGPEQDDLGHGGYSKRTRGRPACRKYRPGSGPRCRARRPGTPWRARWKSPAR